MKRSISSIHLYRKAAEESVPPDIESPPNELKSIIDKMAQYVVRNGPEFEMMMKSKKDQRFSFLEPRHQYNAYYEHQVTEFRRVMEAAEKGDSEGAGDGAASQRGKYSRMYFVLSIVLVFILSAISPSHYRTLK